jgi:hypothetical protein
MTAKSLYVFRIFSSLAILQSFVSVYRSKGRSQGFYSYPGSSDITAAWSRRSATGNSVQPLSIISRPAGGFYSSRHGAESMMMIRGVKEKGDGRLNEGLVPRWILNSCFRHVLVGLPLSIRLEFPDLTAVTPYGSQAHLSATASYAIL